MSEDLLQGEKNMPQGQSFVTWGLWTELKGFSKLGGGGKHIFTFINLSLKLCIAFHYEN